jgi:hypothetical protein
MRAVLPGLAVLAALRLAGSLAAPAAVPAEPSATPAPLATPAPTQPVDWPELPDLKGRQPQMDAGRFHVFAASAENAFLVGQVRRWTPEMPHLERTVTSRLKHPIGAPVVDVIFAPTYAAACPARGLALAGEPPRIAVLVDETTPEIQVRAVLAHEMAHVVTATADFVGDGVLTEGIANWAAAPYALAWQGLDSWDDAARRYLAAGVYVAVSDPKGLDPGPREGCLERRDRVYNARAGFTGWLIDRIGVNEVLAMPAKVVREPRNDGKLEEVRLPDYRRATGLDLGGLEALWLAQVTGVL